MAVTRVIKPNPRGIVQLLKSPEVKADLRRRGAAIQAALPTDKGEEWGLSEFDSFDRASVLVRTANAQARRRQAEDNELIRALDRGR
ncbi:hypothetical protein SEA_SANASANA_11 [Microbacterium phage SanaSana]|uniref:hypothetical protein n=1 Tax=Microbacterium phage Stoor TaxID=2829393 RepID=UPI001BEF6F08|nr:hypothetical protein QDW21_gp10 [Microbacterium phage Stoor]QUE26050.1 hypothetical protein SEA_STOOR_10 [Microbacterium phage Stoor]